MFGPYSERNTTMSRTFKKERTDDRSAVGSARKRREHEALIAFMLDCSPQEAYDAYREIEEESPVAAVLVLHELETAAAVRRSLDEPTQWVGKAAA